MNEASSKPVLIAGPTASGKSALAAAIAEHVGGVIINADSMQVYRELRILTARPSPEEEAHLPHKLYGFVPASEAYSVGRFVSDASAAIAEANTQGKRPVIVGGTGLYFKALTEGLSPIPPIDDSVRVYWRSEADRRGAADLHQELNKRDAEMGARLASTDTQRIVRALEVIDQTGTSLAEWQRRPGTPVVIEEQSVRLLVQPDVAELHAHAEARFDRMLAVGAIEEVEALLQLGLSPQLPAMRAIGVGPLSHTLRGECSLEEATAAAKTETRQYIKRQLTWAKSYMISWKYIKTKQTECNMPEILSLVRSDP